MLTGEANFEPRRVPVSIAAHRLTKQAHNAVKSAPDLAGHRVDDDDDAVDDEEDGGKKPLHSDNQFVAMHQPTARVNARARKGASLDDKGQTDRPDRHRQRVQANAVGYLAPDMGNLPCSVINLQISDMQKMFTRLYNTHHLSWREVFYRLLSQLDKVIMQAKFPFVEIAQFDKRAPLLNTGDGKAPSTQSCSILPPPTDAERQRQVAFEENSLNGKAIKNRTISSLRIEQLAGLLANCLK
ncbi:hypothetical protein TTRE_0000523701 [Trichuris trichiura]|uniref:Uncharacterized protein n=1 Tax=Trichuris trichiura TaxID=36087 RepID=A0A077ZAV0_TRITR|nr:hypothetical protein TTRE_0000523701 [Trichuris trichiura]